MPRGMSLLTIRESFDLAHMAYLRITYRKGTGLVTLYSPHHILDRGEIARLSFPSLKKISFGWESAVVCTEHVSRSQTAHL